MLTTRANDQVFIRHTTNTVDQFFGTGKWWDHKVTASRACPVTDDGWDDTSQCIIGKQGLIQLPEGSDEKQFVYEIKWHEGGAVRHAKFGL